VGVLGQVISSVARPLPTQDNTNTGETRRDIQYKNQSSPMAKFYWNTHKSGVKFSVCVASSSDQMLACGWFFMADWLSVG
jgi:hypothetical protein